ncbi:MAG: AAA family ATPase [Candidatus Pacebacteria bacterium]|nr:AAA family ATPase [Candidatus Paceibacterota bacterium]
MTQTEALAIMKTGLNVYLTGSAGSGKTHTLREYIRWLDEHEIPVAITASTGIAATHMNGQTIHGWSGIGIRETLDDFALEQLEQKQYLWKRFEKARVLIIDEVSMLHAHRLDMVERVCRRFKRNDLPFGGLQVILSGDFFQLPPVTKSVNSKSKIENSESKIQSQSELFIDYDSGEIKEEIPESDMVVHSRAWRAMKPAICYLTEQHRQEDDVFLEILNAMRTNTVDDTHKALVKGRMNAENIGTLPTKLYTHNIDVDSINHAELAKISGDTKEFVMAGKGSEFIVEALKKACLAPERLALKIGAEVMFIKNNYELGYFNGTRGKVSGFDSRGEPIVEIYSTGRKLTVGAMDWEVEENGRVKASITQYPLRLAWAITIHKSQGMSMDSAEIDLSKTFTYGMGYVALSRVRTLSGIRLVGYSDNALSMDPAVLALDENFQSESEENKKMFSRLSKEELEKLEHGFILKMGGKIEEKKYKTSSIKKSKASPEWIEKMEKIRSVYPNAGKPWKDEEDFVLVREFKNGKSIEEIAVILGRRPSSINLRLVSHNLIEPDEDTKSFLERQKIAKASKTTYVKKTK